MDELQIYLNSRNYTESGLCEILNKKIMITNEHVKLYKDGYPNVRIIEIFKRYGYVFTIDDYKYIIHECVDEIERIPTDEITEELYLYVLDELINGSYDIKSSLSWIMNVISDDEITENIRKKLSYIDSLI